MMTAKSRGKNRTELFAEGDTERPDESTRIDDVRSIAHLKMLQSLSGKLNRLNDMKQIGSTIASELRTLTDYHDCRVYVARGDRLHPIAWMGQEPAEGFRPFDYVFDKGEGVIGRAFETGESQLITDLNEVAHAIKPIDEHAGPRSLIAVPLTFGVHVVGVLAISQLGVAQFDRDDVRLLEVMASHAAVALENARMYEEQRREAERSRSLLQFADRVTKAGSFHEIGNETAAMTQELLEVEQAALWLQDERSGEFRCSAHVGFVGKDNDNSIRRRIPGEVGERFREFLGQDPQFVTPEMARGLGVSGETAIEPAAVAPLSMSDGLMGWIVAREPSDDPGSLHR